MARCHIVDKLVEAVQRQDTRVLGVSRRFLGCGAAISSWYKAALRAVQLHPDSEAIVTIGSKEGLAHLGLARSSAATRCWCGTRVIRFTFTARSSPVPTFARCAWTAAWTFSELERAIRESFPKPRMMILGFRAIRRAMRRARVLRARDHARAVRHLRRARSCVRRHYLRRAYPNNRAPSIMQVPPRARWPSNFSR